MKKVGTIVTQYILLIVLITFTYSERNSYVWLSHWKECGSWSL